MSAFDFCSVRKEGLQAVISAPVSLNILFYYDCMVKVSLFIALCATEIKYNPYCSVLFLLDNRKVGRHAAELGKKYFLLSYIIFK